MIPSLDASGGVFPHISQAFKRPNGLLAVGGELTPNFLLAAYQQGIFPWFNKGDPILWWHPDPRMVLFPKNIKVSKSLKKIISKKSLQITEDQSFSSVIEACASSKTSITRSKGTWINSAMVSAYTKLHELGYAHSIEVWQGQQLVGGLYGISLGRCFFGESMFYTLSNASKVALVYLAHRLASRNYSMIDCQVESSHLASMGATTITREKFMSLLENSLKKGNTSHWHSSPTNLDTFEVFS